MIQQGQVSKQPIVLSNLSRTHKNPDLLLDMRGILFKPMPAEISLSPLITQSIVHEAHMRDTVIISMDTLPLASLPQILSPSTSEVFSNQTALQAHPAPQKHRVSISLLGATLWYTLAAIIIIVIYMVIPLMTTFIPLLSNTWSRLLIALEILTIVEAVVFCILRRTIRR